MNKIFSTTLLILVLFSWNITLAQKYQGVALTPPMGWNSWNCFHADISEEKIKSIADAMVSSGMKDAGYEYVVIDDGWMTDKRDEDGHIIVDSTKFPNGIKPLADYIHSLGLKFGIYSSPGCYTCQKLMGSLGHEQIDANDYASWGVDFLKYDWCRYPKTMAEVKQTSESECRAAFELMRDYLYSTNRPIVYSVHDKCTEMTEDNSLPWVKGVAHMHRTSKDIKDNWDRMLYCLETTVDLWQYAGPGYWNDIDMLEVGNTNIEQVWGKISKVKMNLNEYRTHFVMWCMVASPLMAGNDLRTMKPEITEILTNKGMIAVNQDPLGKQAQRIRDDGDIEVWVKELSGNRKAVALLNRSDKPADIKVDWQELGLNGELNVSDIWEHKNLGLFKDSFTAESIPSHGVMVLQVMKLQE
ncbi:MAG: glycoside hydrolase family 27 protein [Chlorobi bacterium]|nr:glycoside hydrolase family 27 protein [Chlorobiota bacterium]